METPITDANLCEDDDGYTFTTAEFSRGLELALAAAKFRIAQLERGEYICHKCGLRQDGEKVKADF